MYVILLTLLCLFGQATKDVLGEFATGLVSEACLRCICVHESGCQPTDCHFDASTHSLPCGYFQINRDYWVDCGSPGNSWPECAEDINCSSQCVQNYMNKYVDHNKCPRTCETYVREHKGGANGCNHASTVPYWHAVQSHAGCNDVI